MAKTAKEICENDGGNEENNHRQQMAAASKIMASALASAIENLAKWRGMVIKRVAANIAGVAATGSRRHNVGALKTRGVIARLCVHRWQHRHLRKRAARARICAARASPAWRVGDGGCCA
jgi:hypothetical protein